jgi:FAD/FMN-containing dehydrogenase
MRLLPQLVKKLKGGIISLMFSFLPELWMTLTGGIPKLVMLAEFSSDSDEEAMTRTIAAQEALTKLKIKTKLIKTKQGEKKYWIIRRESFNLLRHHVQGMRTAPFIDDFVVRPDQLGEFLPQLYKILDKYKLIYTIAGHVGDGNFHIIPLMKVGDTHAEDIIERLGEEVYDLVFKYHGSMTGEHNDGLIRSPYLEKMYGLEICELFAETKQIFDPQNIFNPGKKVNSSLEYSMKHLDF